MINVNDTPIYSLVDVINTLNKVNDDKAYEFASELTGISIDRLAENVNDKNSNCVY